MFDFAQQAERLGSDMESFAQLVKMLNVDMLSYPETTYHIDEVIGSGAFNRAVTAIPEDNTFLAKSGRQKERELQKRMVLEGPELLQARKEGANHHGLFAALKAIHHPLLGFAQNLFVELDRQGFRCAINHEGREFIIPLEKIKIDFSHSDYDNSTEVFKPASIFTRSAIRIDETHMLPEKFILSENFPARISSVPWTHRSPPEILHCRILDAAGQPLEPQTTANLLWIGVAGQGKNIYEDKKGGDGRFYGKAQTLAINGIDDMRRANDFLIETVQWVQKHNFNPEPLWDRMMESARHQLEPHLSTLALARESMVQYGKLLPLIHMTKKKYTEGYHPQHEETIDNVMDFFGITLPPPDAQQQEIATTIARGMAGELKGGTRLGYL